MLQSTDLLINVRNKLKSEYDYAVYLDDSKENCESPCFFLDMLITRTQHNKYLFQCNANLYITYFAEKGVVDSFEMYQIKDNIQRLFANGMQVNDRYIKFKYMECETDGEDADIIYFTFKYEYLDNLIEENTEYDLIEKIYNNMEVEK